MNALRKSYCPAGRPAVLLLKFSRFCQQRNRTTTAAALLAVLFLTRIAVFAQSGPSLPVYTVVQSGATSNQASVLGDALGIPASSIANSNGALFFIDPVNYLSVPTKTISDTNVIDQLLMESPNKAPSIPLRFEQIDFTAVNGLAVLSSNTAVANFSDALAAAGLSQTAASPFVTHAQLFAEYTNDDGSVSSAGNALDTQVQFQFNLGGIPLIGPGAQAQVNFGPNGQPTRLWYSARQLTPGASVSVISSDTAIARATSLFPGFSGPISVQLVYFAPPLSETNVSNVIPYYLCSATTPLINPQTGQTENINSLAQLIPATDDPRFIPTVTLTTGTNSDGTEISATAAVSGGTPPYTFSWGGSGVNVPNATGSQVAFSPTIQVAPPLLSISQPRPGVLSLNWVDKTGLFQLQSSPTLITNPWPYFTGGISSNSYAFNALVPINPASPGFYRLALSNSTVPVNQGLSLNVIDANGVFIQKKQILSAYAQVIPISIPVNPLFLIGWGTEGPYDQDFLQGDTQSWRKAMSSNPVFGQQRFYNGEFVANAIDFIDNGGDNNQTLDAADIDFYAGHGNTNLITFTLAGNATGDPAQILWDSEPNGAWGNVVEEWLCLLSCNVLAPGQYFNEPDFRWGHCFDGLHEMLGFSTEAYAGGETQPFGWGNTFEEQFVYGLTGDLSHHGWTLTLQQSWFNAADTTGPNGGSNLGRTGDPAVLGPLGPGGVSDLNDYWWGEGSVGPRIRANQIRGWYYMTE